MHGLIDTDVLHKGTSYGLFSHLVDEVPLTIKQYSVLGAAKYVVRKKLKKKPPRCGEADALRRLDEYLAQLTEIEPTEIEIKLAAELELLAQKLNVPLDSGESMLCAVLSSRKNGYIFTGDKRAIIAAESLIDRADLSFSNKLVCLEQLFHWLVHNLGIDAVREYVCQEPEVDKALTNCFSCHSDSYTEISLHEGLSSYINDLRRKAPRAIYQDH